VDVRGVMGASAEDPHEAANAMIDHQNMDTIASATGGRALYGSNHESDLMDEAIDHGESYYTLSYAPSNAKFDGSERRIEVTLAKKSDYRLTYRRVYYAVPDEGGPDQKKKDELHDRFMAAKAQDTLWANIAHGAPMLHDLLFTAHLAIEGTPHMASAEQMDALQDAPDYFLTRKKKSAAQKPLQPIKLQKYVIDYGVIDPRLKAMAAQHDRPATLEFAAAAYNDDGRLLNSMLNHGVPPEKSGKAVFHAVQELEVPPGAAFIRLAVRDTATNRTGTLEVRLPLKDEPEKQAMGGAPVSEKK
jgi:hypothetical protein